MKCDERADFSILFWGFGREVAWQRPPAARLLQLDVEWLIARSGSYSNHMKPPRIGKVTSIYIYIYIVIHVYIYIYMHIRTYT